MVSFRECGLEHRHGELFVAHGDEPLHPLIETCKLERAMREAHAAPLPVGSVAYHATPADVLDDVLTSGLDPAATFGTCQQICFAPTPEIAAGTMEIVRRPSLPPALCSASSKSTCPASICSSNWARRAITETGPSRTG